MASGGSTSLGVAGNVDRVKADIVGQANLIRAKIQECHMQYAVNGTNYATAPCAGDPYPCSDQTDGTLVSALTCPNDPLDGSTERNLWTGIRLASLPPASKGFDEWHYMNAGTAGGRCIWTAPTTTPTSGGVIQGLTVSASKFTSQEVSYSAVAEAQKFVVFITRPTGTIDTHCELP
ncbi:MAG TPA: hypothetical protein DD400_06110 [Rhodospirillaceae bacterium]|nr:hypothetical protein [Rhodospirillaceae bacterium]